MARSTLKIRLINPAQYDPKGPPDKLIKYNRLFLPSLALPTIAALTPDDVEVQITDEHVQEVDFDEEVDLVGLTAQTSQAPRAYQIAAAFRRRGIKTIMGGLHASLAPQEAAQHVDSVVVGEAEDLWERCLADLRAGALQPRYQAEQRPDLQRQVIPRFDLLDARNYARFPLSSKPFYYLPVQTTRGCPFNCEFCAVVKTQGNAIRHKPIENVVQEIRPESAFLTGFTDDNIAADPAYTAELFAALKPLKIHWYCQLSTTIARHPKLIEAAADAGCLGAFVGMESLSSSNLRSVNKGFNRPDAYPELLRRLTDVGIMPTVSLIYGLEHDTYDSLMEAVETLRQWDVVVLVLWILTPYPGTRLYERLSAQGRLCVEDWSHYDAMHPVVALDGCGQEELERVYWSSYERFYSLSGILRQTWRCRWQYLRNFPRNNIALDLYYLLSVRQAVHDRRHPFSLGY